MLKFFKNPFAITGTRSAVPATDPGTGEVNYPTGYTPPYQLPKTDPSSRNIERDKMNQLFFDITNELQLLQANGVPDFITTALNEGSPYEYGRGALVRYDDGVNGPRVFVSRINTNTDLPTVAASWSPVRFGGIPVAIAAGTANALTATFSPTLGLTPTGTLFLLRHAATNTAAATLAVDGGAAKPIVKADNVNIQAGDIPGAASWGLYAYDVTLDKYVLLTVVPLPPASTAEAQAGTATNRTVTPANLGATVLGIGQTWQSVTRSPGVTYTNTTGRPILLSLYASAASGTTDLTVAGVIVGQTVFNNTGHTISAVIPNGATYSYTGNLHNARELR